jgi:hypothetical protein
MTERVRTSKYTHMSIEAGGDGAARGGANGHWSNYFGSVYWSLWLARTIAIDIWRRVRLAWDSEKPAARRASRVIFGIGPAEGIITVPREHLLVGARYGVVLGNIQLV